MNGYIMKKGRSVLADLADGAGLLTGDAGAGNIFYVDGGSTGPTGPGASGRTVDNPFQTIKEAMTACVSGHNDFIYVLNYGSNGRGTEDWPILVNKDMVHIIGARSMATSKWPTIKPDESDNAFTVTGQRCEFANLEIGGYSTGSGIEIGNAVWCTTIHDCFFGVTGDTAGTHGVYVAAGADAPHTVTYDCQFGVHLTGDGVRIAGNATRAWIGLPGHGNIFKGIAGIAINISGSAGLQGIFDNYFGLLADTAGDAITLAAGTSGIMVFGNRVGYGKTTAATEYFVDASTTNSWGQNWVGDAVALPA